MVIALFLELSSIYIPLGSCGRGQELFINLLGFDCFYLKIIFMLKWPPTVCLHMQYFSDSHFLLMGFNIYFPHPQCLYGRNHFQVKTNQSVSFNKYFYTSLSTCIHFLLTMVILCWFQMKYILKSQEDNYLLLV